MLWQVAWILWQIGKKAGAGWMTCHLSIIHVHFVFLLIEFDCYFFIYFKIIPCHFYYYCVLNR